MGIKFAVVMLIKHIVLSACLFALSMYLCTLHDLENTEVLILKTKALGKGDQSSSYLALMYSLSGRDSDCQVD